MRKAKRTRRGTGFSRIKNCCREVGLFLFAAQDRHGQTMWQFFDSTTGRVLITFWPGTGCWLGPGAERGNCNSPEEAFK